MGRVAAAPGGTTRRAEAGNRARGGHEDFVGAGVLKPKQVAAYLAVSERTVRTMMSDGTLPVTRVLSAPRVPKAALDDYIASRMTRAGAKR